MELTGLRRRRGLLSPAPELAPPFPANPRRVRSPAEMGRRSSPSSALNACSHAWRAGSESWARVERDVRLTMGSH
uniref:Uncharacterized protein n=1 Tax=Oryza sativa subsp. japonica TaxID=39947 RepID=Q69J20_ORYSJ|nr:hypothetical protein [Oryza sativa Japonica Group]BAD32040.1 hypothetical protein [Oryza sativa Japonica Group]